MLELPVEEEQEQDEDFGRAHALAHHRRGCTIFHPSVGGGDHFICNFR